MILYLFRLNKMLVFLLNYFVISFFKNGIIAGKQSNEDALGRESPPSQTISVTSEQPTPTTVTVTATITRPTDDEVRMFFYFKIKNLIFLFTNVVILIV